MKTKKKPRSRTVKLNKCCKVILMRSAGDENTIWREFAWNGVTQTCKWYTPAELRRLAKAYLEMAGDE